MSLSNTLSSNEVKNAAGTGISLSSLGDGPTPRSVVFGKTVEDYALPLRLTIQHVESGAGLKKRRRSVLRFDETVISTVDSATPVTGSVYIVADAPIGALLANTPMANLIAYVLSLTATTGAGSTVLFDGSGNGAKALLNGSL
jgi:hypothetical protein